MAAKNKFGWHSGVLKCKDAKILQDLYVQDDIVFSDVSAGVLGVTGGIDMTGTTSAIGIDLTGSTCTTAQIAIGTGTSTPQTMAEAEDFALAIYTTCADTDGANTAKPLYVNAAYTGAGQVARAAEFVLRPTAQLGGWCNAVKGYTDFAVTAAGGGSTGLASAVCAEMRLPNGACAGAFYPMEIEWVGQTNTAFSTPGSGSQSGFIYCAASGTVTDMDADGVFFSVYGLTAGGTALLSTNSQTLKCNIGTSTTRYLVLSQATDCISFAFTASITEAIALTVDTSMTVTTGMSLSGAGTYTTGIKLDATAAMTDGILISATTPVDGIHISSACSTTAINIDAQTATSIDIGACATGINFSGAITTTGINFGSATFIGGDTCFTAGTTGTPIDIDCSAGNTLGLMSVSASSTTNASGNRQFITSLFEAENKTNAQAFITLKALQANVSTTVNYRAGIAGAFNFTRSSSGIAAAGSDTAAILASTKWGSDATQSLGNVFGVRVNVFSDTAATNPSALSTYGVSTEMYCTCTDILLARIANTGSTADVGLRIHALVGTITKGILFDVDTTYGTLTTAIEIENCATGLAFVGTVTTAAIDASSITLAGGDYLIKAGTTATSLDVDLSAANCLGVSTISICSTTNSGANKQLITTLTEAENSTADQAYVSLKALQANTTITKNYRAAYGAAISVSRSSTAVGTGETVGILVRNDWGSDATQTPGDVFGVRINMEADTAATNPSSSTSYALSAEAFCTLTAVMKSVMASSGSTATSLLHAKCESGTATNGIHIDNDATMTSAIKVDGTITQVFDFDDAATCVDETSTKYTGTCEGHILVKMPDGGTAYINCWSA